MTIDTKHLYEKVGETTPGKWAYFVRELDYSYSHKWPDEIRKKALDCANYLEHLALEELKNQIPPWTQEIKREQEKNGK